MKRIVCIGSVNIDVFLELEDFCKEDDEQSIKRIYQYSGGSAANIASGLGRLGNRVSFFGNIGSDSNTQMLLDDFEKDNVDYEFCIRTKNPNNTEYILIDKTKKRQLYAYNNIQLNAKEFPDKLLEDASFIIFTSLVKDNAIKIYAEIAERAKERGIKIALDPGAIFSRFGFDNLRTLAVFCDYMFPTLNEVKLMADGIKNIDKILDVVPNVIVTDGSNDVQYFRKGKPPVVVEVKNLENYGKEMMDATGAGDCFVAAFISALLEGKSEEEALNFASLSATISVTKRGGRSMPTREEVERFVNEQR